MGGAQVWKATENDVLEYRQYQYWNIMDIQCQYQYIGHMISTGYHPGYITISRQFALI